MRLEYIEISHPKMQKQTFETTPESAAIVQQQFFHFSVVKVVYTKPTDTQNSDYSGIRNTLVHGGVEPKALGIFVLLSILLSSVQI